MGGTRTERTERTTPTLLRSRGGCAGSYGGRAIIVEETKCGDGMKHNMNAGRRGMKQRTETRMDRETLVRHGVYGTNDMVVTFATWLFNWRRARGLTLKHMAADLGFSSSVISEWEHANRFPAANNLQVIAEYTGTPVWHCLRPQKAGRGPNRESGRRNTGARGRPRARELEMAS